MKAHLDRGPVALNVPVVGTAAVLIVAGVLGTITVDHPLLACLAASGLVVAVLTLARKLSLLVPLTTAALVLGSSSLPISAEVTLPIKFGLMAATGATAVLSLTDVQLRQRFPIGFSVAFLGLAVLSLVSSFYSATPAVTVEHAISLLILWVAVCVAIPLWCRSPERLQQLLRNVGFMAGATVAVGMVLSAVGAIPGFQVGRFHGLLINPNTLGYFVAPILPPLALLAARTTSQRMIMILIVGILLVGLVLSGSRAGLLSAFFGTLVGYAVAKDARRALLAAVAGGLVIATVLLFWDQPVRPSGEGLLEIGTGGKRTEAWPDGLRLISQKPLTGHGFATTPIVFPEHRSEEIFRGSGSSFGRLHNSYLEAAMDLGWPGAAIMALLALSGLVAAWKLSRVPGPSAFIGAVLVAGISGGLMEAVFETGLIAAGGLLAFHFWMLVAAAHTLRLRAAFSARGTAR
jgi:O-antigen ligase